MKRNIQFAIAVLTFAAGPAFSSVTYIHTDHLGSVVAESNSSGAITKRFHYKPFGESIEPQQDDVAYTGHKHDVDLGLTYMQARYYDPVLGRFFANDPQGFVSVNPMSFGRYSYANNSPYNYIDPNGEDSYWVARPSMAFGYQHSYILQTTVDADGKHTFAARYTFGSEGSLGGGKMINKTGSRADVDLNDAQNAEWVIDKLNDNLGTVVIGTIIVRIDAPDEIVAEVADSVEGSSNYQLFPEETPGDGTNSNTAPAHIAIESARIAGNEFEIPSSANVPGTDPDTIEQIVYKR